MQGARFCSLQYQTRLGSYIASPEVCVDCCPHLGRVEGQKGGWEVFLAESVSFTDCND